MKSIFDYNLYIFDLDNTLYDEDAYLHGSYKVISEQSAMWKPTINPFLVYLWLTENKRTPFLFNNLIEEFGFSPRVLDECLSILRTYKPEKKIVLYDEAKDLLTSLKGKKVCILTNGNIVQQKNKIDNIEWEGLLDNIKVYFAGANPKPNPYCVFNIMKEYREGKEDTILIGDSHIDRRCADYSGIDFQYILKLI